MHIGIMEPTKRSLSGFSGQKTDEAHAAAGIAGQQSSYMTNMILPEIVQSSKNSPLGPDCVITQDEVPDQSVLINMDLYWLISLEKGCVECRVMVGESAAGKQAVTQDPRVIVTKKPRRFEAYCCAVCRQNFVTVVQALLHMKAFHRKGKKILIQDQNVFHDIEKAMEVPPVPLPWYASKRTAEPLSTMTIPISVTSNSNRTITTSINTVPVGHTASIDQDISPVTLLLQAVVKEYNKPVNTVLFGKNVRHVTIKFEDHTTLLAHLPDATNQECLDEHEPNGKLEFTIQRLKTDSEEHESCMIHANNPQLAQKLLHTAIRRGVTPAAQTQIGGDNQLCKDEKLEVDDKPGDQQIKRDSRGRPSKTVRFMLGSPDSDEEGSSSASERVGGRDSTSPLTSNSDAPDPPDSSTIPTISSGDKNAKDDEGLKGVVNQLISTASKGLISPVSPTPPAVLSSSIQEEVITNAAFHARFMPKNLSVPNLPSISIAGTNGSRSLSTTSSASASAGLTRVQSWGGSNPSSKIGNYTPHVSLNITRDDLRRSFVAGRSYTYAEKIKLMNKLNDEDTLITQEHVKGAGKLMGGESSRGTIPPVASLPCLQQSIILEKPLSPTVMSSNSSKLKKSESDLGPKLYHGSEIRRKRRSKYDIDQFGPTLHYSAGTSRDSIRSSSEGSVSDKEEDNPPTLLNLLRGRPGTLLTGSSVSGITNPVISDADSDYYGSGEWANAAMQTLKNLQSTISASEGHDHTHVKVEESIRHSSAESISSRLMNTNTLADTSSSSMNSPFVNVSGPPSSGSAVDTIVALAQQITSEHAHLKHLKRSNVSSSPTPAKRSFSPLLTETGKESFLSSNTEDDQPKKRLKKDKPKNTPSSIPDSNMTKPIISNATQKPHVIAKQGDGMAFTERVTDVSLQDSNKLILKFLQSTYSSSSDMDMPSIFSNSVDTFMAVRYIEKFARCKVCGFSTPVDTVSNSEVLKSHVMEHSLKELVQAGSSGKQL